VFVLPPFESRNRIVNLYLNVINDLVAVRAQQDEIDEVTTLVVGHGGVPTRPTFFCSSDVSDLPDVTVASSRLARND
jgi:hypothetical protein